MGVGCVVSVLHIYMFLYTVGVEILAFWLLSTDLSFHMGIFHNFHIEIYLKKPDSCKNNVVEILTAY